MARRRCPLASILLSCTALAAASSRAAEPRYRYYFGGEANVVEPSATFTAVATPSAAARAELETALRGAFGAGARAVAMPRAGVTLVRFPDANAGTRFTELLAKRGLERRLAFGGRLADGTDAWSTIVLPEVRVRFPSAPAAAIVLAELDRIGVRVVWERDQGRDYLVRARSSEQALAVAAALVESGRVVFAHPDMLVRVRSRFTPDDPHFGEQWHLPLIGAPAAWDVAAGASNITIAVIDTGIDLGHPDLQGNLVAGYDAITGDGDPSPGPAERHGTAVAGIAAAAGDNGAGVTGVCQRCKVLPIRLIPEVELAVPLTAQENALRFAREHGARIISNSWGPQPPIDRNLYADALAAEIHAAVSENRIVLFAAGNEHAPLACRNGVPWEPAADPEVIAVGASGPADVRESYSNYGGDGCKLALLAPAAAVTTDVRGAGGYNAAGPNSDYAFDFGGTSAATPVVAGAVGVLLSIDPGLTWGQVVDVLKTTADKIGGVTYDGGGYHPDYGHGRLNLYRAALYVRDGTLCAPEPGGEVAGAAACSDARDNDCDGMVDGDDPSCRVPVGSPCTGDMDCGAGGLCLSSLPGGYCTRECPAARCPVGALCLTCGCDTGAGKQPGCDCDPDLCDCNVTATCSAACACDPDCDLCVDLCMIDADCRSGYVCAYAGAGRACLPGCVADPELCGAGETCDALTGWCAHDGPTPVGGACAADLECADSGLCFTAEHGWPAGYCAPECRPEAPCPAGTACVPFIGLHLCLDPCDGKVDCRPGYGCWPMTTTGARVCYPSCATTACEGETACCVSSSACEPAATCAAPACSCDTAASCQAACSCDADCAGACACDDTDACTDGCACDPGCPCACDLGPTCAAGCPCDRDCPCACDTSRECEAWCLCDPDCADQDGCGCVASGGSLSSAGLAAALALLLVRRRRRRA